MTKQKAKLALFALLASLGLLVTTSAPAHAAVYGTVVNAQSRTRPIIWTSNYYPGPLTADGGIYYGQSDGARQFVCTEPCKSKWGYVYPTLTKIPMNTTGVLYLYDV
jgi:hypothetical protein